MASFSSAAAESIFYEVCDYVDGKALSLGNVAKSMIDVTVDTLINGSIKYCCNLVSAKIPSIKTNSGWFIPKSISSYFTKTYG